MDSQGLQRKLLVVYFLMFILPTVYLLFCAAQILLSTGPALPRQPVTVGLLFGIPAIFGMSIAGFLLLYRSFRQLARIVRNLEAFLDRCKEPEASPAPPAPTSADEVRRIAESLDVLQNMIVREVSDLHRDAERLRAANDQLTRHTLVDPLTGLYNYRHAMHVLNIEIMRAAKDGAPLSLLLIDIAELARSPDANGTAVPDAIVQAVGTTILANVSRIDLVARDEVTGRFVVILLDTNAALAGQVSQRLREAVASTHGSVILPGQTAALTISVGAGSLGGAVTDIDGLVRATRASLAAAKRG